MSQHGDLKLSEVGRELSLVSSVQEDPYNTRTKL